MSEIKQINTGKAELLIVKVPEGACHFGVSKSKRGNHALLYSRRGVLECKSIKLPPGNWTPLGIDTELTEEQCIGLVEGQMEHLHGFECEAMVYPDFTDETGCYFTAKEAFASLMQANECYTENPIMPPDDLHSYDQDKSWLKEYEQAEANTGTWLILKRLS